MKDYQKYVVWLDYFNSELKRNEGRRVPLSAATKAPRLEELEEACRKLNLVPVPQKAHYPATWTRESGYVSVTHTQPKQALVMRVARELAVVRGKAQKQAQTSAGKKK
jgi:signal recognition particle subunit SRP19